MMRSMFSAVSGLKSHQEMMDVIGNNIANVNTPGFKKSRISFEDMLYQNIQGASRPVANGRGGTNPIQIGPGVGIGSIDTIFSAGSLQDTGKDTDLGISGDGFFSVSDGSNTYYTRNGDFNFDQVGNLVSALNGLKVQGWTASNGVISTNNAPTDINIPTQGASVGANATTKTTYAGNLNAAAAVTDLKTTQQTVYDSLGSPYTVTTTFTKEAAVNSWTWKVTATDSKGGNVLITSVDTGSLAFDPLTGKLTSAAASPFTFTGANSMSITPDFSGVTQYDSDYSIVARDQDGYQSGSLESLTFDSSGTINGVFSNGISQKLAQVALASFSNSSGLQRQGDSMFSISSNSGAAVLGTAGTSNYGTIKTSSLEASNVDLSTEFTNMIIAERGFEANSKVITTSDQMLQTLVNLKQ
jgi:flagellar hook protein FlgE